MPVRISLTGVSGAGIRIVGRMGCWRQASVAFSSQLRYALIPVGSTRILKNPGQPKPTLCRSTNAPETAIRMPGKEATARIKINKLLEAAGLALLSGRQRARQHLSRTQHHDQVNRPGRARRQFRENRQRVHRLPPPRRQGLPIHRSGGESRRQESARRQGAGPQVRPFPELPFRHPLQREPALFLGPRTRQPLPHHLVSDARFGASATKRSRPTRSA